MPWWIKFSITSTRIPSTDSDVPISVSLSRVISDTALGALTHLLYLIFPWTFWPGWGRKCCSISSAGHKPSALCKCFSSGKWEGWRQLKLFLQLFLAGKWLVKDLRACSFIEGGEALRRSWGNFLFSSSPQKSPCSHLQVNWRQLTSSVFSFPEIVASGTQKNSQILSWMLLKCWLFFNNCIAQKDSELGFLPSVSLMLLFLCKQSPPFKISHVLYFFCFIMIKMHIYTIT